MRRIDSVISLGCGCVGLEREKGDFVVWRGEEEMFFCLGFFFWRGTEERWETIRRRICATEL